MSRHITQAERQTYLAELSRRSAIAEEKGEEIRKNLEPELVRKGYTGHRAYVDVHTGHYVVDPDPDQALVKARELGEGRLCWGFYVGVPPKIRLGALHTDGRAT